MVSKIVNKPILFELEPSWHQALANELQEPYIASLAAFVELERRTYGPAIYPPKELVFEAFRHTPFDQVKVVIVGQDPYHGPGQAHGLCFSVPKGIAVPPSLQNIFKEQQADLGLEIPTHGSLERWAEQGILLLNATLTVRQADPMSHHGKGWENFTDAVIARLALREDPIIFVLWGKSAQEKCRCLESYPQHHVLKAPHPSPFSAHSGFFGCRHFSKINELLIREGKNPIDWKL